MNAISTAAAVTVLAASTAAFAAQTPKQPSSPSSAVPNAAYQYQHSGVSASSDAASCQPKGEAVKGSATSTAFAARAAEDGEVEVGLAGRALRKSRNDQVRQFARRMAQDYAQYNGRLESLVKCEGLVLPTKLDGKHNATIEKLEATSGRAFDRAYLKHIEEQQSKAVPLFESAARSGNPDVAAFARDGLSMLQEHQVLADNLRGAVGTAVASSR